MNKSLLLFLAALWVGFMAMNSSANTEFPDSAGNLLENTQTRERIQEILDHARKFPPHKQNAVPASLPSSGNSSFAKQGSWKIIRDPNAPRAMAVAGSGATIEDLAKLAGLDVSTWAAWLRPTLEKHYWRSDPITIPLADGRQKYFFSKVTAEQVSETDIIAPGFVVWIPNTVVALWYGQLGGLGKSIVGWKADLDYLRSQGFLIDDKHDHEKPEPLLKTLSDLFSDRSLHGLFVTGHGGFIGKTAVMLDTQDNVIAAFEMNSRAMVWYRLGLVIINTCYGRKFGMPWVSENGVFKAADGILIPPFNTQHPKP